MHEGASLRIALLTRLVNPRGGVVHTLGLANALHAAGHAVTVFAPAAPGQRLFREPACQVLLVPVAARRVTWSPWCATASTPSTHLGGLPGRGERFDVWHTHDSIGGNALADLQAGRRIDGFVRTVHHLDHFDAPQHHALAAARLRGRDAGRHRRPAVAQAPGRAHGIEAVQVDNGVDAGALLATRAACGCRAGAAAWVSTGVVPSCWRWAVSRSARTRCACCRPSPRLHAVQPGARLLIAGGVACWTIRPTRRFDETLAALGWRAGPGQPVQLLSAIADADMPRLYRLADVVAMPSTREGFGLVVLEALASGVPVVASRIRPSPTTSAMRMCRGPIRCRCRRSPTRSRTRCIRATRSATAVSAARLARRFNWPASSRRAMCSSTAPAWRSACRAGAGRLKGFLRCPSCISTSAGPTPARRAATRPRWWCRTSCSPACVTR